MRQGEWCTQLDFQEQTPSTTEKIIDVVSDHVALKDEKESRQSQQLELTATNENLSKVTEINTLFVPVKLTVL